MKSDSNDVAERLGLTDHLLSRHHEELKASGLSIDTILAAGIYSVRNPDAVAELLARSTVKGLAPAMVFPYFNAGGKKTNYARVKPDVPLSVGGKPAKYLSPRGKPNQVYFPPGLGEFLDQPEIELVITEGEKKALKGTQEGFKCLGLVGVWGWKQVKSERLLPALSKVTWKGRTVYIAFDSDVYHNDQVQDAESRLAQRLMDLGAKVRVVRLPEGPLGTDGKPTKVGLDDYLVKHSSTQLRKLLDEAVEAEPLSDDERHDVAAKIDPRVEIASYLKDLEIDGVPQLRYWNGVWYFWELGSYRVSSQDEVKVKLIRRINETHSHLTAPIINNLMEQLRAQTWLDSAFESPAWIADPPVPWPADEILATRNTLVHLPSFAAGLPDCVFPATPRFLTTSALEFDFERDPPQPDTWFNFLEELWPTSNEAIDSLQEWFGYFLTPDTRQHKILLIVGPKRSGKGTIARVLTGLAGRQNVAGPTLASLATNFGLWPLIGKSLAIVSDARLSGRADLAIVLERLLSISGEDAQTIDRKNLAPITMKLPTRLMILTNELPQVPDASGALTSRFILLHMTESFYGHEDTGLTKRLLGELSGILLWAIEGWRRLRERGHFIQPEGGEDLLNSMHELSSPIRQFIEDCCQLGPEFRAATRSLFNVWQGWCDSTGRKNIGTEQTFGRDLVAALPQLKHTRPGKGGDRQRGYIGIALKPEWTR